MIMSWLLGFMTPDVSNTFMLYPTVAAIWTATREIFSQKDNISESYELEMQLRDIKQGDMSVSKYYSNISQIWQQIDSLELYQWGCSVDGLLYKKIKEEKRIFGFLSDLHKDLDAVRGKVLSTKPLLTINAVFSEVGQEENRLKVMMGPAVVTTTESSALLTQGSETSKSTSLVVRKTGTKTGNFTKKYCRYCHREGHVIEKCYRRPGSTVKPPTKEMIGGANHQDELYILETIRSGCSKGYSSVYSCMDKTDVSRIGKSRIDLILLWHRKLGHPNFLYLKKLNPDFFNDVSFDCIKCETYLYGKQSRAQYPPKLYGESKPFNLIHSDIWGLSKILNVNGRRWFVIFVDDHTRVTWIYLMKHKSDLLQVFKTFISLVQNQFNTSIKNLRTDNGSIYMDKEMKSLLSEKGIHHHSSAEWNCRKEA